MAEWLIPWTGRGRSRDVDDNLLWRSGRLYVMDNHRLALWCWWQHLGESRKWNFVHIDRHRDTFWLSWSPWARVIGVREHRRDLSAYRDATFRFGNKDFKVYRWDNIVSGLWTLHERDLASVAMVLDSDDHGSAEIPGSMELEMRDLVTQLDRVVAASAQCDWPYIIDVDLDCFSTEDGDGSCHQCASDKQVGEIGELLRQGMKAGVFAVVTVALSPETTGSWDLAEHFLEALLGSFPEYRDFMNGAP